MYGTSIAERLHQLVALQAAVLGLVGMTQDDLVDRALLELLRLDRVLLRGTQQVIEERDVQLQHLDELEQAAVGDVELTVEVERARIRIRTVLGDATVVDVARELGRVLVLLVLGLERADADAVGFAEEETAHTHVLHHLAPIATVALHQLFLVVATDRIQVAFDAQLVLAAEVLVQRVLDRSALFARNEHQRVLIHRRRNELAVDLPTEGVDGALIAGGVLLEATLQQSRDRALRRTDGTVQQQDASLGTQVTRAGTDRVDQAAQRTLQTVDRIVATTERVVEQTPATQSGVACGHLPPVGFDHAQEPLPGVAREHRLLLNQGQVLLQGALPVEAFVTIAVVGLPDQIEQGGVEFAHGTSAAGWAPRRERGVGPSKGEPVSPIERSRSKLKSSGLVGPKREVAPEQGGTSPGSKSASWRPVAGFGTWGPDGQPPTVGCPRGTSSAHPGALPRGLRPSHG